MHIADIIANIFRSIFWLSILVAFLIVVLALVGCNTIGLPSDLVKLRPVTVKVFDYWDLREAECAPQAYDRKADKCIKEDL